jgi:hypothetical protein
MVDHRLAWVVLLWSLSKLASFLSPKDMAKELARINVNPQLAGKMKRKKDKPLMNTTTSCAVDSRKQRKSETDKRTAFYRPIFSSTGC